MITGACVLAVLALAVIAIAPLGADLTSAVRDWPTTRRR